ncbi:MAG: hypothetical protein N2645_16040 [Clostridia bacterium]|nr:hypothetical protein [Clostridia bacterium]
MNMKNKMLVITLIQIVILSLAGFSVYAGDTLDTYNNVNYPNAVYKKGIIPSFEMKEVTNETISPQTGDLELRYTDLFLKGRNGLDFSLTRYYSLSQSNLFEDRVIYLEGSGRYSDFAEKTTFNEKYFDIGAGWAFDLPVIETREGHKYLHYGSSGVWPIEIGNGYSNLQGHYFKDIVFNTCDYIGEYTNGEKPSTYKLTEKNGKIYYFHDDGRLLGIKDRFGNEIKFLHTMRNGYPVIRQIIDSVGRIIDITYDDSLKQYNQSEIIINVTDPKDSQNSKTIRYRKCYYTGIQGAQEGTEGNLSTVSDAKGRVTSYNYELKSAIQSGYYKYPEQNPGYYGAITNYYACLTDIVYPTGAQSKYNYMMSKKNLGTGGAQYYKVTERYDFSNRRYTYGGVNYSGPKHNYKKYTYNFDGTGEYDGYPSNNFENNPYCATKTKVTDEANNSEVYTYSKYSVCTGILKEGLDHKSETINFYYNERAPLVKKVVKTYNKNTNQFILKAENYLYNLYMDMTGYWDIQTETTESYNPVNDEHKTTYEYDSKYHFLKWKVYKKDANTLIKEDYIPTSDGKNPEWKKIYENSVLKTQTQYLYDAYGNVIEERNYHDDGISYTSTKYSFNDNDPLRNGKFNGAYVTQKYVENVKDADGNTIGTVGESYKYDWFGNVIEKRDGKNQPTTYQYDKMGRVLKEIYPDSSFKEWEYNDVENSVITYDEKRNAVKYGYNEFGDMIYRQDLASGAYISCYEYDSKQRITGEFDYNSKSTEYRYNSDGKKKGEEINEQYVWFDNSLPTGAVLATNTDIWDTGYALEGISQYNVSEIKSGLHQHAFENAARKMKINAGDHIFVHVYLPSGNMPTELMLQFKQNGSWNHRAYWGADNINLGTNGTSSKKYMGALPTAGTWATLVIPAREVGLENTSIDGIAITLNDGQIYWDKVGAYRGNSTTKLLACETYTYDDANANGLYQKITKVIQGDVNAPSVISSSYINKIGKVEKNENTHLENSITKTYTDTFKYDYLGNKIEEKIARASDEGWTEPWTAKYEYNYAGKPVKVYDVNGNYTTTEYDALGRVKSVTDIKGNKAAQPYSTTYAYDNLGRVIEEKIPFENVNGTIYYTTKKHYYDNNGNVTMEKVSSNKPNSAEQFDKTGYEYNSRNMLTKVITYNNGKPENYTQYYYDAVGNKVRMYTGLKNPLTINGLDNVLPNGDANYSTTKYEYDQFNRLTKMTDPLNKSETYTYDLNGNMTGKLDRNGNTFNMSYDALGRLLSKSVTTLDGKGNASCSYSYTLTGNKLSMSGGGLTVSYKYDDLGRLISESEGNGFAKEYSYDSANNRKSFILKQSGTVKANVTYEYDKLNRLWKVYEGGQLVTEYGYDENGNRKTLTTYPNGTSTDYQYNIANKLTMLTNKKGTNELSKYQYTYYLNGNQESKAEPLKAKKTEYIYDGLGRLTAETDSSNNTVQRTVAYQFDDYNNRRDMSVTEAAYTSQTSYVYDLNNRLTTETKTGAGVTDTTIYTYDDNGNQLTKKVNGKVESSNQYDGFNQLTGTITGNIIAAYAYDGNGLRVKKETNGQTIHYINDGNNIAMELDGSGRQIALNLWGINLISRAMNNIKVYYMYNGHGDVVALTNTLPQDNLAQGKTVTSSSTIYNPAYASDGSLNTNQYTDLGSGLKNVVIDIGKSEPVDRIKLWHFYGDGRKYKDVVVQLSNNPNFIEGVTTVFNNDADNSAGQGTGSDAEYAETADGKEIKFNVTNARYIRLWTNGSTANTSNHYVEIQAFRSGVLCTYDYDAFGNIKETYGGFVSDPLPENNLAKGKIMTSSSVVYSPAYATDGVLNTYQYTDLSTGLKNIVLDVGKSESIDCIKLWHYYGDARKYKDVIVQLSNDPNFAEGVITVFNNDNDNSAGQGIGKDAEYVETSFGKEIRFDAVNARYIRFWTNGSTVNGSNHYVEIQVFKRNELEPYNPFRYCGEYFDKETGTIYLRARYYNPGIGRFITEDSFAGDANDPLSLNLYTYCHNNPINGWDPTGHAVTEQDRKDFKDSPIVISALEVLTTQWGRASSIGSTDQMNSIAELAIEIRRIGLSFGGNLKIDIVDGLSSLIEQMNLNPVEKVLAAGHMMDALATKACKDDALERTVEIYGDKWQIQGNGDAFRHTLWNALMQVQIGTKMAKFFGDAHEFGNINSINNDKKMDLLNNNVGRKIGYESGFKGPGATASHYNYMISKVSKTVMRYVDTGRLVRFNSSKTGLVATDSTGKVPK